MTRPNFRLAFIHPIWLGAVVALIAFAAWVFDLKAFTLRDGASTTTLSPTAGLYVLAMAGWVFDIALASRQLRSHVSDGRWLEVALGFAVISAGLSCVLALLGPQVIQANALLEGLVGSIVTVEIFSFFALCAVAATALTRQAPGTSPRWTTIWHFYALVAGPLGAWLIRPRLMMLRDDLDAVSRRTLTPQSTLR